MPEEHVMFFKNVSTDLMHNEKIIPPKHTIDS